MKRITVSKDPLAAGLKWVKQVVDRNPLLDVLDNVLVKVDGKNLSLTATDLVVTLIVTMDCAVENLDNPNAQRVPKIVFLLPIDFLHDLLQTAMSDLLLIETDGERAIIRDFFDETDIGQLEDVKKYPKLPVFPDDNSIDVDANFITWLVKAKETASTEAAKSFSKVLLDITADGVFLASTNAKVIFEKHFDVKVSRTARLLIGTKIIKALKGITDTTIYWNKSHLAFKAGNVEIIGTLQDEKFPEYKEFLKGGDINLVANKYDLLAALEKVQIATKKGDRRTVIWLRKEIGAVILESHDTDLNRKITARIGTDYTGDVVWITIDPEELYRLINQAEDETLPMSITDSKKGIIIKSETDPSYTGFIMPIA